MPQPELINFIKESLAAGRAKQEIIENLLKAGWFSQDIQEAFKTIEKTNDFKEFNQLRWLGSLFGKNKKIIFVGMILLAVAAAVIAGWQLLPKLFPQKPAVPSLFQLEASLADAAGVSPGTTFILKSSQDISEGEVKKILKFSPEIDFTVEKNKKISAAISSAFAQTNQAGSVKAIFEIKPAQSLKGDEIYQAQITDPDLADHEYGWAFQVKATFQVVQTHPRDKGTSVPVSSGIEIVFNRENLISPQDFFEISPAAEGTFEQSGNTLIFLPKNLVAETIYTVKINKGLKAQGSEDVLEEDLVFTFETGEKSYTGARPYFDLGSDFLEFISEKKPTFEAYYYNLDPNSLEFNVYQFTDVGEFLNSYQQSRQWAWSWTRFYRDNHSGYDPSGQQKTLSFKPSVVTVGYQKFIEIPQVLGPGYYLLDTLIGGKHKQTWLQITPLSRYFSLSHEKGLLWVYDFLKKEPRGGLRVSFVDKTGEQSLGVTNSDGLAEFLTPDSLKAERSDNEEPKFLKAEGENYQPFLIKIVDSWCCYRQSVDKGDSYWDYLSTDRYIYQMSDTLRYWGVVKGRQEDLRQKKVKVGLYEGFYWWGWPRGGADSSESKLLVEQEVAISQFDTIQGELSFKGLSPGYYTLAVKMGDDIISTLEINIMSYAKPVYQITVTPSRKTMYAGETVNFQVKANFFDGTPVNNLRLKYSGYWENSFEGELTLDQNGNGNIFYTPTYYEKEYYPRTLEISFSPALSEEGEIWGSGSVLVFGPNLYLQADQERLSGDNYRFTAKLNKIVIDRLVSDDAGLQRYEYIGDPQASYPLNARIFRVTYQRVEIGQYYDPIDKVVRKRYEWRRLVQEVETLSGTTNNFGEWVFEKNLPSEQDSFYEITFEGKDSQGRVMRFTTYAGFASYNQWKEFSVSLNISGESYTKEFAIGEKVKLQMLIMSGEKPANAKILFYRFQNNIDKIIISPSLDFEEIFEEKFLPSVQYQAVVLGPYGFEETNSVTASFKKTDRKLNIEINPDKEGYRPGEEIAVNLSVKNKDNQPVPAQINVAAVDEAMFHILPYNWRPRILETLYSNIYTWLITGASQYAAPKQEGAEGGGCFAGGTPILLVDGSTKPIEKIKVGDQVLTFESSQEKIFKPAIVQGASQHLVEEYLLINDSLKVTPNHRIYVSSQWIDAGLARPGEVMLGADGLPEKIHSIKRIISPKTLVYNIVVGQYHTYFASNYFVHNQGKGEARVNFVDVAHYQTVQADSSGQAKISFRAPDNITAWRTTALAFFPATLEAGQGEKLINVSLPFFVDVTLSNYYLARDNPYLRLRAAGTAHQQNENTEFAIQSETLGLNRQEIVKQDNVFIQLGQLKEGEHEIKISARQGQLQDSLIRKIKAVKSYFKKAEFSVFALFEGLTNIEGNQDGFTKLLLVDEGRGKFFGSLLSHSFLSGLRADQVTADFLAQKMLAQYFHESPPSDELDLSGYQTPNGGLGLFPYSDDDLELSAKLADLVPEFISQSKLKEYFRASLSDKKADIHRITKALYGLASLKEPVLLKINLVKTKNDPNLEDKIYLSLALAKLGDRENARQLYQKEIRPQFRFQGPEAWLAQEPDKTKQVKLTAIAAVLTSYLDLAGDQEAFWRYLATHNPERDLDVLEETMVMKSELAESKDEVVKFSYQIGPKSESVKLENGRSFAMTLSADEFRVLKFSEIEGKISLISFYERSRDPNELAKNEELSLTRQYLLNNSPTNSFGEGNVVLVRLDPDIAASAIDGAYQIVDYLPSGLRPITQIYQRGLPEGEPCNPIWYPTKIVENAIYFQIYKGFDKDRRCANRTINYYARVVSRGDFEANPAMVQSLKDLDSLNLSLPDRVEIK